MHYFCLWTQSLELVETIIEWDERLFLLLNGLGRESLDGFWLILTEKWTSIPLYLVLLILIQSKLGWKRTGLFLFFVVLMITISDQSSNISKDFFQRLRPCDTDLMDQMRFIAKRCGKFGFFSAHASSTFSLAILIGLSMRHHFKWILPLLISWSFLISYSRIYIGVHYPTDLIVGWIFGFFLGLVMYFAWKKIDSFLFLSRKSLDWSADWISHFWLNDLKNYF